MAKVNKEALNVITPKYIFEDIKRLYEGDQNLTMSEAVYLAARFYGHKMWCPLDKETKDRLESKYLDKNGNVDTTHLKFSNPSMQQPLQIPKLITLAIDAGTRCSDAKLNETTEKVINNLAKKFLSEEDMTESNFISIAKQHFNGDIGPVKYYLIFKSLFPSKTNDKFNSYFGIDYEGTDRFTGGSTTVTRFNSLFREVDIGLFLYGTYLCAEDSIQQGTSYMPGTGKYLDNYKEWYLKAEKAISSKKSSNIISSNNTFSYDGTIEM